MNTAGEIKQTAWGTSMGNLSSEISNLKDRLECLANRVEPVLSPSQPTNAGKNSQPISPRAKVIQEIDNATERIIDLKNIINEIIQRLEI